LLVWQNQSLVGQMGVEYRVLGSQDGPLRIFGAIDVCVAPECRNQGIATQMLTWLEHPGAEFEGRFHDSLCAQT